MGSKLPYDFEDYCSLIKLVVFCGAIIYMCFLMKDCSHQIVTEVATNSTSKLPSSTANIQPENALLSKDDILVWRGGKDGIPLNILREAITTTLDRVDLPYNDKVIKLLVGTVCVESYCGRVCESEVNNADFGIFQINIHNEEDIWEHYLKYNPTLKEKVEDVYVEEWGTKENLKYNLSYQIILAYLTYQRKGAIFPVNDDVWSLAWLWKSYYNTHKGLGTTQHFYDCYKQYVRED